MNLIEQKRATQQLINAGCKRDQKGRWWWRNRYCLGFSTQEALTSLDALIRLEKYFSRFGTRHYRPVGLTRN